MAEVQDAGAPADPRLFHLVSPAAWSRAEPTAPWCPPSLASEGFVHLSFAHQLAGTLAAHFAAGGELLLLEVDPAAVAPDLRLETSRGGEPFPHLFRGLERVEVLGWWPLGCEGGCWELPRLAPRAAADAPPRRSGAPPTARGRAE